MKDELPGTTRLAGNIVLIYALFSSLWLLCSDGLLPLLVDDTNRLMQLQMFKGWVFVISTSVLLYALVRWRLRSRQTSYSLLRAVIQGTTDAIFVKNLEGHYLMLNAAAAGILGRSVQEAIGKDDKELFAPEIARQIREKDSRVISSGNTQVDEEVFLVEEQERTYLSKRDLYRNSQGKPIGLISVARDITEQKQLLEELQREKEDLAALSFVTANSVSTLNLEELLELLLRRIVKVMRTDAAVILLKKDNQLRVCASIGIDEDARSSYVVAIGEGFAGTIATTMQPLYIEDATADSRVSAIKPGKIRSMLGVPLKRHGELVGVLHVDWMTVHPKSDREFLLLEVTAERCTMAILNAQLFEQTQKLQKRLQLQIEHMPIACIVSDRELRLSDWNPAAEKIFGFSKEEILGKNPCQLIAPAAVCSHIEDIFRQLAAGEATVHNVNENLTKDRGTIICEWYNTPLKEADGTVVGMLSMAQDITERKRAEQELRRKDEQYRTLARNFPNGAVFLFDRDLRYTLAEGAGLTALGLSSESFEGKTIGEVLEPEMSEMLQPIYRKALAGITTTFEVPYGEREYFVQVVPVTNSSGEICTGMAVLQDITDRKQTEAQLRRNAYYDPLTGLPNRTLLLEHLEQLIERVKRGEAGLFAILLLKLEHFELVKYSLGHQVADQLAIAAARRLETYLQPPDTVAQLRTDEFAILLTNIEDNSEATEIAERLYQLLMLPFNLNGREVFSTINIGIALGGSQQSAVSSQELESRTLEVSKAIPNPLSSGTSLTCSERPEDFLHAADTARHHAKMQANASYAVFNPAMHEQAVSRLQLETDLRQALKHQQFQVYYQPIVSLETGKITGFEALVRWIHPTRGMVSPVEFIPIAEETGLIGLIDWWVMRQACAQLKIWQQEFAEDTVPLTMSVNLSGIQLTHLGLLERLDRVLRETGVEGGCLKLEITESGLLKNETFGTVILQQLKTLGVQLSIDDFGTGYSSLARLHQLPIDTLKIDRSFVSRMGNDGESLEIIRAIMNLAHTLEMDVIAEGVETQEQLSQLRSLHCEYGQGYFFSRPIDSQAAEKLLASHLQW
jgi:PAS domain S-box-containing protein/diguanylate cyclase (GGDEF)-like protein